MACSARTIAAHEEPLRVRRRDVPSPCSQWRTRDREALAALVGPSDERLGEQGGRRDPRQLAGTQIADVTRHPDRPVLLIAIDRHGMRAGPDNARRPGKSTGL